MIKIREEVGKMKASKKCAVIIVFSIILLTGGLSIALAQTEYPNRPIEIVVPYNPGGSSDIAQLAFKDRVAKVLGQPVVPVYKPGAGSAIGAAFVAKSKPDGYTLLVGANSTIVIAPLTRKDIGYTMDDFIPICTLSTAPMTVCVRYDNPYKTMKDFIEAAKTKKMKYSTYGTLTVAHICMEALCRAAGFQAIHIPYSSGSTSLSAVLGGHVDIGMASGSLGMLGPDKLRIVAVAQKNRYRLFPEVPSWGEIGYPIDGLATFAIWAPKNTPKEIVNKIYEAFKKVVEESGKEIAAFLEKTESDLNFLNPEETRKVFEADHESKKKTLAEMGMLIK